MALLKTKRLRARITKMSGVKIGFCLLFLVGGSMVIETHAKTRLEKVSSTRSFDKLTERSEMTVAVFYEKDKKKMRQDRELATQVERIERIFSNVSRSFDYKEAEILFLLVDTSRGDLNGVLADYEISSFPTYMLFKFGVPVKKEGDKFAALKGMVSSDQIRQFIDNYFKDRVKNIVEEKAKLREKRAEESYYYGWGWGWGYPYPYYYWNYPYYGCGYGRCWW